MTKSLGLTLKQERCEEQDVVLKFNIKRYCIHLHVTQKLQLVLPCVKYDQPDTFL